MKVIAMRKVRFTEHQIIAFIKMVESERTFSSLWQPHTRQNIRSKWIKTERTKRGKDS
jgi:hypothetical protein